MFEPVGVFHAHLWELGWTPEQVAALWRAYRPRQVWSVLNAYTQSEGWLVEQVREVAAQVGAPAPTDERLAEAAAAVYAARRVADEVGEQEKLAQAEERLNAIARQRPIFRRRSGVWVLEGTGLVPGTFQEVIRAHGRKPSIVRVGEIIGINGDLLVASFTRHQPRPGDTVVRADGRIEVQPPRDPTHPSQRQSSR